MQLPDYYEFFSQAKVTSGNKAMEHIPVDLGEMGAKKPLVISSKGVTDSGLTKIFINAFAESGVTIGAIFDDASLTPGVNQVDELSVLFFERGCDSIIAIGGGAAVHLAKGVRVSVSGISDVLSVAGKDKIQTHLKPFVLVPTGCFDGYEASNEAILDNISFVSDYLFPDIVVIDRRMVAGREKETIVNSSLIAFTHSFEALVESVNSPMADAYSYAALQYISKYLLTAIKKPAQKEAGTALANSSVMAAIAFSNSPSGIVHNLAIALERITKIKSGLLMGILLPAFIEKSFAGKKQLRDEVLLSIGGIDIFSNTDKNERGAKSLELISSLLNSLGKFVPKNLKEFKIPKYKLEEAANLAVELSGKKVKKNECLAILDIAYEQK